MAPNECRVARNQKVGLLAIADTEVILQDSCNASLDRDNAIQFCGLRRLRGTTREAITSGNFPLLIIIKRIIKTCNMIEHN